MNNLNMYTHYNYIIFLQTPVPDIKPDTCEMQKLCVFMHLGSFEILVFLNEI